MSTKPTEPQARLGQSKRPTRPAEPADAGDPASVRLGKKPPIAGLFALYTLARLAIFAVLFAGFWAVGLGSYPGILFALLLSMPLSYFLLGRIREPMTERLLARRAHKQTLRAQLRGEDSPSPDTP